MDIYTDMTSNCYLENSKESLIQKVICIINKNIEQNITLNDFNTEFSNLGIDSLDFIKIVVEIENEFEIEIDDEMLDINIIRNINSIIAIINDKLV